MNGMTKWLVCLACFSLGQENLTFQINGEKDDTSFQLDGEVINFRWGGPQLILLLYPLPAHS